MQTKVELPPHNPTAWGYIVLMAQREKDRSAYDTDVSGIVNLTEIQPLAGC